MSMPDFPPELPDMTRDEVINAMILAIALSELGLSHIINSEGEKIQYALGTIPGMPPLEQPATIEDLLKINESVRCTLDSALHHQLFLNAKLQAALCAKTMKGDPGATGPTGPTGPYLSCYTEVLANAQYVAHNQNIHFDPDSSDEVGDCITLDDDGNGFTIHRPGLYHIEWNLNLSSQGDWDNPVVVGILENGEPASGASSTAPGGFSSGTLIEVTEVPFTVSLFNYGRDLWLSQHPQYEDSAGSIRILRFADGAIE